MKYEKAFGVISVRKKDVFEVLLVQHRKGEYWAFPKGHAEIGEEPKETALRELKEETGLSGVRLLNLGPFEESYVFEIEGQKISKDVLYFVYEVEGDISIQNEEILKAEWLDFSSAERLITYPQSKKIFHRFREEFME